MDERNDASYAHYAMPNNQPAKPPKPTVRRRTAIIIGVGGLILGAGIGAAGKNNKTADAASTSSPGATVTTTMTAHAPAAAPVTVTAKAAAAPAPATTAQPKPAVVFTTSGDGIKKTASFTTGPEWSVTYTFDCASSGGTGNFMLDVGDNMGESLANALAAKGGDTSYEHDNPGKHYLSVNSECNWTLKVTDGG